MVSITSVALLVGMAALGGSARGQPPATDLNKRWWQIPSEVQTSAPVDHGLGPGVKPARTRTSALSALVTVGSSSAATEGVFGTPVQWPIIAIHMVLLPDGRVMDYGSGVTGQQGAQFVYDVWDPTLGTGSNAHMVLPNTTDTDLFCGAQLVLPSSGQVLVTGGDLTINGKRNYSQNDIELFTPASNTLTSIAKMQYPRWYPTLIMMPNGEVLVMGGRTSPATSATVPEVYNVASGWRTLTGAASTVAFTNWYYPRGFVNSSGNVFLLTSSGKMYTVTTAGTGTIVPFKGITTGAADSLPAVLYAPNQVLAVRNSASPEMINIGGSSPVVTPALGISQDRFWASGTVMADGRVLITGGSLVANELQGVAYASEIWNPATNQWSVGASATKPRLYHSNALLLPDGSVITAGGGAPGPVVNLNAEIYYPSYLYQSNGQPAVRPSFTVASSVASGGGTITGTVGVSDKISEITFVRTGSATHSTNMDQRLFQLPFTQTGEQITAMLPSGDTVLIPGYYLIFAFNAAGTPAIGSIVLVQG